MKYLMVIPCGGHAAQLPCRTPPLTLDWELFRHSFEELRERGLVPIGWVLDLIRINDTVTAQAFCGRCARRLDLALVYGVKE